MATEQERAWAKWHKSARREYHLQMYFLLLPVVVFLVGVVLLLVLWLIL
jgi:hypothetical protein